MSFRPSQSTRLPVVTRAFHWITAALVTAMFLLAWGAEWGGPGTVGIRLIELHRSVGVVLFLTVVARLTWRLTHPLPPLPDHVDQWERWLASTVQALLYMGLLAMPLLGWTASDSAGDSVRVFGLFTLPSVLPMAEDRSDLLFAVHGWTAIALLTLVALHVAGALKHRLVHNDGVLERMI